MKRLVLLMFFALTTSCDQSDKFSPDQKNFAFIISRTQGEKKCNGAECKAKISSSSGSGAVIKSLALNTYVLTAGHVCEMPPGDIHFLAAVDNEGTIHTAIDSKFSKKPDLCLIKTAGQWGTPANLSKNELKYGDQVISMAAPNGIFESKMVLLFDGRYSGRTSENDDIFAIPCAPGSSGSAILNKSGEIVSVVHSASKSFQNMAVGSNKKDIEDFLKNLEDF